MDYPYDPDDPLANPWLGDQFFNIPWKLPQDPVWNPNGDGIEWLYLQLQDVTPLPVSWVLPEDQFEYPGQIVPRELVSPGEITATFGTVPGSDFEKWLTNYLAETGWSIDWPASFYDCWDKHYWPDGTLMNDWGIKVVILDNDTNAARVEYGYFAPLLNLTASSSAPDPDVHEEIGIAASASLFGNLPPTGAAINWSWKVYASGPDITTEGGVHAPSGHGSGWPSGTSGDWAWFTSSSGYVAIDPTNPLVDTCSGQFTGVFPMPGNYSVPVHVEVTIVDGDHSWKARGSMNLANSSPSAFGASSFGGWSSYSGDPETSSGYSSQSSFANDHGESYGDYTGNSSYIPYDNYIVNP